jgi:PhnB protein
MEVPEHHKQAVIPHIMVDSAAEAIEFYAEAFGAVELFRLEGDAGRIVHAEVGVHQSAARSCSARRTGPGTDGRGVRRARHARPGAGRGPASRGTDRDGHV